MPNPLWKESGQSAERRLEEAETLYQKLSDDAIIGRLTEREQRFVYSVGDVVGRGFPVSPKQLFWLRDLCDKYGA